MDFAYTPKVRDLQARLTTFMEAHVYPAAAEYEKLVSEGIFPEALLDGLKEKAKAAGLWNLFLPALREDEPGTRLSNTEYAPLAEIMGRLPWASEVFNCNPPDTGNMEILHLFATPGQRSRWLNPLLEGTIRSAVSITEPDQASSDPTNLQTSIRREGDHYVINGRKWFTSGALHPKFAFTLVMGISDPSPEAPRHARHSFVIVPADTPAFAWSATCPSCTTIPRKGIVRWSLTMSGCRLRTFSARRARALPLPRRGWVRGGSITACALSGNANMRWS